MSIIILMKRKVPARRKTRQGSSEVGALIRRLESEITRDEKVRADATARIFANRKLLDAAKLVGEHLPDNAAARKARRPKTQPPVTAKAEAAIRSASHRGNGTGLSPEESRKQLPAKLPRGGGSVGIVLSVLQDHPQGLAAPDVKRKAAEHPEAPVSLKEHGQYIYSVLDTLKIRGQAERGEDGKWRPMKPIAVANAATH